MLTLHLVIITALYVCLFNYTESIESQHFFPVYYTQLHSWLYLKKHNSLCYWSCKVMEKKLFLTLTATIAL